MSLDTLLKIMSKKKEYTLQDLFLILKGGPGSGNHGHAGIPGKRGGSVARSFAMSITTGRDAARRQEQAKEGVFFKGNIKTSTPEDIYNGSSQEIKDLADKTGIIATDKESKAYIEEMQGKFRQKGGGVSLDEIDNLDSWTKKNLDVTPNDGIRYPTDDRSVSNYTQLLNLSKDERDALPSSAKETLDGLDKYYTKGQGWHGVRMAKALEKLPQDKVESLKEEASKLTFKNAASTIVSNIAYASKNLTWEDRDKINTKFRDISKNNPPGKTEKVGDYIKRLGTTTPEGKKLFSNETPKYGTKEMIALTNVKGAERQDRIDRIEKSWDNSVHRFGYNVKNVFSIKHQPEVEAAYKSEEAKYGNVKRMWHGASTEAARGINSTGFKITPNPKAGRMLGDGIYLTTKASKSAQYLASSGVTRSAGTRGVLMETKSALGKVKPWTDPGWMGSKDADSIFAKKGTTDTGYHAPLLNDEYANRHAQASLPTYWVDTELK